MGKKRKSGKPFGDGKSSEPAEKSSKLNIETYEDVADSEDEFLLNRDKVLLDEGPEAKRRRKLKEQDEFLEQDEEALAYSDESASEEDFEDAEEEAEGEDDFDDMGRRKGVAEGDDEEDKGWGHSRSDYYNADAIQTEQDALDEEAEALRIQKKQLQAMADADYGFDEAEWAGDSNTVADKEKDEDVVTEVLPQLQLKDSMGNDERLKLLKSRYPEFDHLAKDFVELQPLYDELSLAATAAEKLGTRPPRLMIKYQALASYLSSIAMYFALLTSTFSDEQTTITAKPPQELRNHPVIDTLVQCRTLWNRVEKLSTIEGPRAEYEVQDEELIEVEPMAIENSTSKDTRAVEVQQPKKLTKAQKAAAKAQAEADAKQAERRRKTEEDLAALSTLTEQPQTKRSGTSKAKKMSLTKADDDNSDLGEETELTAEQLAEKARRKRSLKFYTSQITQKSNKRSAAGRDYGGDMDVPHRERLRDRQARLNAEAEKRGKKKQSAGADLGDESDEEDRRQAREIRGEDQEDEYYDMVAARSKKRKLDKAELASAYAQAAREGGQVIEEEVIGPDGKRAIGYVISKNKGLTPKRSKDVRNPRVKKRKKYEEKKKKLKSMKPVYSGGEQKGGYRGELTGIKSGLIKSVKL